MADDYVAHAEPNENADEESRRLRFPTDDPQVFVETMGRAAVEAGVEIRTGVEVRSLDAMEPERAGDALAFVATLLSSDAMTRAPTEIEVSIEGLGFGTQITAGDLKLPQGATLAGDPADRIEKC